MNCLKEVCRYSSWLYCSVVDFIGVIREFLWRGNTVNQVGIIVLTLISYGVIRELLEGDML